MRSVYAQLNSRVTGLTPADISPKRSKFGWNELEVKKPESWIKKLLRQFRDLLVLTLIAAGLLALALHETVDAIVILVIVVINALIGFVQEFRTERMLEALQKLVAPTARVLRSGKEKIIPAREIVPGDVLILEEGAKVPADAVLTEVNEMKVDEAILTGESVPVHKFTDSKKAEEYKVFSGTVIATGSGKAVVSAIGAETEFGKVAKLTTETQKSESPLTKEMKTIGVFVGKISIMISVLLFVVGYFWQGHSLITALLFAVAVAVAAVPEGLPVTITTALALGMQRLAKKKALVRELKSVETLGATTVICSDKTGTLTRNQMVVRQGFLPAHGEFVISGTGYDPRSGRVEIDTKSKDAELLFQIVNECNEAELTRSGHAWKVIGDPTEGALRVAARKFGIKKNSKKLKTFPFDSDRKRMSVVVGDKILAKGAPEQLLDCCTHFLEKGRIKKLSPTIRKQILAHAERQGSSALRVLGAAFRNVKKSELRKLNTERAEQKLVFVGLLGMIDAPRREVRESVQLCQKAGIRITVITGDFGITARAIAEELGIASKKTPLYTGEQLGRMSAGKLRKLLKKKENIIFARVKPADKLRIVEMYKQLHEVVAVTGDGVNDAPALKRADIGVAMGRTGADVAREAASLVLTDDSFASVVMAVAEGRRIYGNMRKFILYIFSCNIGELTVVFFAILLGLPLPLTAILILLVDLGTDLLPSLALGIDPPNPETMERAPRNTRKRILEKSFVLHFVFIGLVIGILVLAGYIGALYSVGWRWGELLIPESAPHIHAMTFAFATLVIVQLFNAFNFRSEIHSFLSPRVRKNLWLWGAVVISLLLVLVVTELPVAQRAFGTIGLTLTEWFVIVGISASVLIVEETRKIVCRTSLK
ncbi:MAG: cation-transporting P-type ATPase [Patescibacteria group bacterium]